VRRTVGDTWDRGSKRSDRVAAADQPQTGTSRPRWQSTRC